MTRALIFANGELNDGEMVRHALQNCNDALIIAADGGAKHLPALSIKPDIVIGDMDSISPQLLDQYTNSGAVIFKFPAEKNETDLELALLKAVEENCTWIRIIGAVGDRFDQTLANVSLMALPELKDTNVRIVAGKQEIFLMSKGTHRIEAELHDTISVLPLGQTVKGITTTGLQYPLNNGVLEFGPALGISNVVSSTPASIEIKSGTVTCVHTIGRA